MVLLLKKSTGRDIGFLMVSKNHLCRYMLFSTLLEKRLYRSLSRPHSWSMSKIEDANSIVEPMLLALYLTALFYRQTLQSCFNCAGTKRGSLYLFSSRYELPSIWWGYAANKMACTRLKQCNVDWWLQTDCLDSREIDQFCFQHQNIAIFFRSFLLPICCSSSFFLSRLCGDTGTHSLPTILRQEDRTENVQCCPASVL